MSVKAAAPCRPLKRPRGPLSLASWATSCSRLCTSAALAAPAGLPGSQGVGTLDMWCDCAGGEGDAWRFGRVQARAVSWLLLQPLS